MIRFREKQFGKFNDWLQNNQMFAFYVLPNVISIPSQIYATKSNERAMRESADAQRDAARYAAISQKRSDKTNLEIAKINAAKEIKISKKMAHNLSKFRKKNLDIAGGYVPGRTAPILEQKTSDNN